MTTPSQPTRGAFVIKKPAQLRALHTPLRQAIVEALLEHDHATAAELAERLGVREPTLHYHLNLLERVGLLGSAGASPTGGRPARVFRLVSRDIVLDRSSRDPEFIAECVRGARLMLRRAERDQQRAIERGDPPDLLRLTRSIARLDRADVRELNRLLEAVSDLLRTRDNPAKPLTVSVTAAIARLAPEPDPKSDQDPDPN